MNIAEQLKKKRIELQMSQEAAADKAGISRRTLAYYESGERIPNAENLIILCNLYGLDVNDLISNDIGTKNPVVPNQNDKDNTLAILDNYLRYEEQKRQALRKGILLAAIILTSITFLILGLLVIFKFVLMSSYGYSFSEATAELWTSFFKAMIDFVNDPNVIKFPVVSVSIASLLIIGWIIYFVIRKVKNSQN